MELSFAVCFVLAVFLVKRVCYKRSNYAMYHISLVVKMEQEPEFEEMASQIGAQVHAIGRSDDTASGLPGSCVR